MRQFDIRLFDKNLKNYFYFLQLTDHMSYPCLVNSCFFPHFLPLTSNVLAVTRLKLKQLVKKTPIQLSKQGQTSKINDSAVLLE